MIESGAHFLNLKEVSAVLRCHVISAYRLVSRGRLPGYKLPGCGWRVREDELAGWAERFRTPERADPAPRRGRPRGRAR